MFCAVCGSALLEGQRFCKSCGTAADALIASGPPPLPLQTIRPNTQVRPPLPQSPQPAQAQPRPDGPSVASSETPTPYAGFWVRAAAYVLDYFIVGFTLGVLVVFGAAVTNLSAGAATSGPERTSPYGTLLIFVLLVCYAFLMECSPLQATLGKMIVRIKVTDLKGKRISFRRSFGRWLAHLLDALTLGIGLVMPVFTERRQCLHDIVAGTLVVRQTATPDEVVSAGPAPRVHSGLVAIAIIAMLLFGPFGIGMLAAISIPAYQEYTIRAQVASALNDVAQYKAVIAETASNTPLSDISSQTLTALPDVHSPYTDSIKVESGAIFITFGAGANLQIRGQRLALEPGIAAGGDIVWVCGRAKAPAGLIPAIESFQQYTTVADRYLPVGCRTY
jgi:uncharacterized RDD family membrane protein YckC